MVCGQQNRDVPCRMNVLYIDTTATEYTVDQLTGGTGQVASPPQVYSAVACRFLARSASQPAAPLELFQCDLGIVWPTEAALSRRSPTLPTSPIFSPLAPRNAECEPGKAYM